MNLPRRVEDWPADAREEAFERACLVFEGCNGTEDQWPAAKEAAERMGRRAFSVREGVRNVPIRVHSVDSKAA